MSNEQQLIDRARSGDADAYGEIVRHFHGDVRAFLRSRILDEAAADDLAQEVFVGGFKSIATFRGNSSIKSWLISIAKNKIVDFIRSETRKKSLLSELQLALEHREGERLTEPVGSEFADVVDTLKQCIAKLQPEAKQMVGKFYYEDQSAVDIGKATGQKPGSIRMNLLRIRRSLAKCIRTGMGKDSIQ